MKNYYYNMGDRMFELDNNGDFPRIDYVKPGINIDYSYRIKEDGLLRVKDHFGKITEYKVKENDIVFLMYSNTKVYQDKQIIILHDERFVEYFKGLDELLEEERKSELNNCCNDCECCDSCCKTSC